MQTEFQVSGAVDLTKLNKSLAEMQAGLRTRFEADHIPLAEVTFSRARDLRYVGQGYELRVPLPDGEITDETLPQAWKAFHYVHASEYGRAFEASPIEIVNIRVSGIGHVPKLRAMNAPEGGSLDKAKARVSPCLFRVGGKLESFETSFYRRSELPVEETFSGPAVILQTDSTTLVPPGATADVDWTGNIIITLRGLQ